jgi:hypothetical protein
MSDEAKWCGCVERDWGMILGTSVGYETHRRSNDEPRFMHSRCVWIDDEGRRLWAHIKCLTCHGTGRADTVESLGAEHDAVTGDEPGYGADMIRSWIDERLRWSPTAMRAIWTENGRTVPEYTERLIAFVDRERAKRTQAPTHMLVRPGDEANARRILAEPPAMPLRDRYIALIARERAKRTTPEADTVDSLAREMAASTGDSPDHWRAYIVSVCGGIAFSKESRHIWNREPTPGLGDRIAAFTDRERAKRAAADRALAAAHMALTFPPVVFVTKGEHDKALARIAELEQQVAAPRCPTDADWSTLDAALVACAKLDERTIPAVTAARATIAAVRDAVTEIGVTAAVGAFGRLAGSASPASTLAATIPAEPVGMASDCDEGGEW